MSKPNPRVAKLIHLQQPESLQFNNKIRGFDKLQNPGQNLALFGMARNTYNKSQPWPIHVYKRIICQLRLCQLPDFAGEIHSNQQMISEQFKFFLAKYLTSKSGGDYTEIEL